MNRSSLLPAPSGFFRLLIFLAVLLPSVLKAGLINSRGLWDFDGTFASYWSCFPAVSPDGLTAGTDYSFTSSAGYQFLQTQPFLTAAKRLTVPNSSGPNGGPAATRTNQWSVVMDVRFDSLSPYAGILQLDPANAGDVSFYVAGASGSLTGGLGTLSGAGAVTANTWYRLALTCGNDGAGGPLTVKAYLNGVLTGTRTSAFDGAYALRPAFLLLSDNNGEVQPAKLNSLGLWGEELPAADIATLGGPRTYGLLWPGFSDANCPVLDASPRAPVTGQGLTVSFSAPSPLARDRLALFLDGDALTAANVKRAIYIGGGATPTTAPSGGMHVLSTSGLAPGRYWLHYLPGDSFQSAHRIAIRIDASPPALTVTPAATWPGGTVSVSGAVEPGSPGVRILLKEGYKELPVDEGSVNAWGQFTIDGVPVPADAPAAATTISIIPTGTTEPEKQTSPFIVSNAPLATLHVRVARYKPFPQVGIIPLAGVRVSAYFPDGELSGTALTQADGTCTFPGRAHGTYVIASGEPGTNVVQLTVPAGASDSTVAELRAPAVSVEPCEPSAQLLNLEAITESSGLFAGSPPTSIGRYTEPVFASFANVGASGAQRIVFSPVVRFDCTVMTAQNVAAYTFTPGVKITLPANYAAAPVFLRGGTAVNGEDNVRRFSVTLDVSTWPAGSPALTVEAGYVVDTPVGPTTLTELQKFPGAGWVFPMTVTDLQPRWRSGKATAVQITAVPDGASNSLNYQFSGAVPSFSQAWNANIDLGLLQLENSVSFGAPVQESYSTDGGFTAGARAEAVIRLLGFDVLNEQIAFQSLPPAQGGLLGLTYRTPVLTKPLFDQCWPIPGLGIDARKCIKLCFVGCKKCVGISAGAFACISGRVDVEGSIAANLRARATVTPHVTLATPIRIQIDAVVCSGGGEIKPQLDFSIPVNLDFDPLQGGFGAGCVKLNAILNYYVRCFGFTLVNGSKNLAEKTWGTCPAGAPLARSAPNAYGTIESPVVTPAVAANASCQAMAVWTGDANLAGSEGPGQLYYRKGNVNGSWEPAGLIPTGGSLAENPAVAWLDETRALCVWTHPKSTPVPPAEGADAAFPSDLELRWSIYQNGTWSAPQFMTNDNVWDVRPVLASDGAGHATCVWLRLNQPNPSVEPVVPAILVASQFSGGSWSAPVSLAPGSPGTDYQPSVRYDSLGNPGVAWLRDPDILGDGEGTAINHTDQSLWYVYKSGASWSAPQQITGLSAAAYAPGLDFDRTNQPCVVCLVPGVNKLESLSAPTGGGGNQSRLWFARRSGGTWAAAELRRSSGAGTFPMNGERPTLRIDTANRAIVVFRRFGAPDSDALVHYTGDVGVATSTLPANGVAATWYGDFYTDDGELNWQIAYDRARNGFCGKMFWIKGAPDGSAATTAVESLNDTSPDPAILPGGFTVSNPHPTTGQSTAWTVRVTNRGLVNAGGAADPLRVEIHRDSATGALVGSGSSTAVLALGQVAAITVNAAFPAGGQQRFFAVVLPPVTATEITAANNTAELVAGGVEPPCNLVVSPAPKNGGVLLDWDVPAGTDNYRYRILRRTGSGPWEIIGYNLWDNFCDPSAVAGVSYEYAVVAEDPASGVISDACSPGFVVLPGLIPNHPGPLPALQISRSGPTRPATLSWLDSDPLLYLEQSPDMSEGSWVRLRMATGKSGSNRTMSVPVDRPSEFFRLRRD